MAALMPAMPTPAAAPADSAAPAEDTGGFTIEIEIAADGTMTGSIETGSQEAAESQDDAEGEPLATLDDVVSFVTDAINNKGQVSDAVNETDESKMSDSDVWNKGAKQRSAAQSA